MARAEVPGTSVVQCFVSLVAFGGLFGGLFSGLFSGLSFSSSSSSSSSCCCCCCCCLVGCGSVVVFDHAMLQPRKHVSCVYEKMALENTYSWDLLRRNRGTMISFVQWRPLLLGWRPSLLGRRPSQVGATAQVCHDMRRNPDEISCRMKLNSDVPNQGTSTQEIAETCMMVDHIV